MELTADQIDRLTCVAEDLGGRVTDSYSGRGMYGGCCIGVTFTGDTFSAVFGLGAAVMEESPELADVLRDAPLNSATMGLGKTVYRPSITGPSEKFASA
jgi:hypothetical protein